MTAYRSLLFVPGHRETWVDKAVAAGAHALILDLEDAVPESEKSEARGSVASSVQRLGRDSPRTGVVVRVNALDSPHYGADLEAVIRPGLDAVMLPKLFDRDDVVAYRALVRHFELRAGMPAGSVGLIPTFETAASIVHAEEIAGVDGVVSLLGAAAKDADVSRAVGFHWTTSGAETLYLRSRIVLAARAAGLGKPYVGLWQQIADLDGLRTFARANRELGFGGQVILHPSHASVVNDEYGPSREELDMYARMVSAYEAATQNGAGAILFEGEHIDLAHVEHARELLRENGG